MAGFMKTTCVMPTVALVASILLLTGKLKAFTYMLLLPVVHGILAFHIANDDITSIRG